MTRRLSVIVGGVLLLFPTVSRAQATAGVDLVGTWAMMSTGGGRACGSDDNRVSQKQEVLVLTADSMLSTHCKEWRGTKESLWGHGDGGARWRVVQDTLVWWWAEALTESPPASPSSNARKCPFALRNNRLTLSCGKDPETGVPPLPPGVYEKADSLRLEP